MSFNHLKSFRVFVFLLLTVFSFDTVYASGMMAADQLHCDSSSSPQHHHDALDKHEMHSSHVSHTDQKQSANDHCSKCGHCMACFSVLPPSQLDSAQLPLPNTNIGIFTADYYSHISELPQKPPII